MTSYLCSLPSEAGMNRPFAMLALSLAASGCATTTPITPERGTPAEAIARLERDGATRRSLVVGREERWVADRLEVTADAIRLVTPGGRADEVPLADVEYVQFRRHGRGFAEGAGHGALVALAAAILAGALWRDTGDPWFDRRETAALSGVAVGLVSIPIGGLIGAIVGHRERYTLTPPPE